MQALKEILAMTVQVQPFTKLERTIVAAQFASVGSDSGFPVHATPWLKRKPVLHWLQAARKRQIQEGNQDFSGFFLGQPPKDGRSSGVWCSGPPSEAATIPWGNLKKTHSAWFMATWELSLSFWCSRRQLNDRLYGHQLNQGNLPKDLWLTDHLHQNICSKSLPNSTVSWLLDHLPVFPKEAEGKDSEGFLPRGYHFWSYLWRLTWGTLVSNLHTLNTFSGIARKDQRRKPRSLARKCGERCFKV